MQPEPQIPQQIVMALQVICMGHRERCNIKTQPQANDCKELNCQIDCPIYTMVKENNQWFKEEFKTRKKEERELIGR